MTSIITKLVDDGNSKAIRIPKTAIKMSGIKGTLVLSVKKGEITIKNAKKSRTGWAEALVQEKAALDTDLQEWEKLGDDGLDDF